MLAVVTGTADHVLRNRAVWDHWASGYAGPGLRAWSAAEPTWGIWGIPEAQVGLLPAGLEVLVTSTAGGIMPVTVVDGRPVGTGTPGPLTRKLRDLYWASHQDPRYSAPVRY